MTAIQILTSGGMASVSSELRNSEQEIADIIVENFGQYLRSYALELNIAASMLKVRQCTCLLVVKDTAHTHFVFANAPGT